MNKFRGLVSIGLITISIIGFFLIGIFLYYPGISGCTTIGFDCLFSTGKFFPVFSSYIALALLFMIAFLLLSFRKVVVPWFIFTIAYVIFSVIYLSQPGSAFQGPLGIGVGFGFAMIFLIVGYLILSMLLTGILGVVFFFKSRQKKR